MLDWGHNLQHPLPVMDIFTLFLNFYFNSFSCILPCKLKVLLFHIPPHFFHISWYNREVAQSNVWATVWSYHLSNFTCIINSSVFFACVSSIYATYWKKPKYTALLWDLREKVSRSQEFHLFDSSLIAQAKFQLWGCEDCVRATLPIQLTVY